MNLLYKQKNRTLKSANNNTQRYQYLDFRENYTVI